MLFVVGTGLIIIATSWGGATYPWVSAEVLAPLVIGSVLFVLFFVYEYLLAPGRIFARIFPEQTPMIPSSLFQRRDTIVLAVVEFATGAGKWLRSVISANFANITIQQCSPSSISLVSTLLLLKGILRESPGSSCSSMCLELEVSLFREPLLRHMACCELRVLIVCLQLEYTVLCISATYGQLKLGSPLA